MSTRNPRKKVWRLAFAALCVAGSSAADPLFPDQVAKDWAMPCVPKCTICHLTNQGGYNTLRPTTQGDPGFGANLKTLYDLNVSDKASIHPALASNKTDKLDSDSDGKPDFDELSTGMDPNDPAAGASVCGGDSGPEYGCVRVAKTGPSNRASGVAAVMTLVGLVAIQRRRTRRAAR